MARTLIRLVALLALVPAGCTATSGPTTTTVAAAVVGTGRLVVLDDGGDIVTMNPDGSGRVEITDDGSEVRYFQPIWSPAGATVAFGRSAGPGASIGFAGNDAGGAWEVELTQFPFYFYWSPDGKRLGLLHNGTTSGIDFEIVDVEGQFSSVVDSGSPYYFSWAPDGAAVVVHTDGNRLAIFDESANPTDIGTPSANFLSPRWTPAGIFYLGDGEVLLRTPDGEERAIAAAAGFANINPNREGSLVAIHTLGSGGITVGLTAQQELPTDSVIIVNTVTGDSTMAADVFALASFWSPDGEKLLMLTLDSLAGSVGLTVWEDGESSALGSILISPQLAGEALQYSDQYAQSWQVWSPGSDSFVLPGAIGDEAGIWVIPVVGEPSLISDGVWAAWSHN